MRLDADRRWNFLAALFDGLAHSGGSIDVSYEFVDLMDGQRVLHDPAFLRIFRVREYRRHRFFAIRANN